MLDVREIDAFFGKVQVISKVSLHIQQREIVSIVGANGAGKTTLLNVIAGLHSSRTGSVAFFKRDISRFTPERIVAEGIILVPEREKVFAPLTVLENLELGAYLRSWRKERKELKRDLDMVYQLFPVLRERKQQLAGTLSGGERQMLALGKAMMGRPRLMMIDERSFGLA
ncbi:MAG: ATP-binding cassette domain-containing protein, partial [Candidatus Bathyarchaeia archaeon]